MKLYSHSTHDYDALIQRWINFAEAFSNTLNFSFEEFHQEAKHTLYWLSHQPEDAPTNPGQEALDVAPIYISAGVHGDESAPVWALVEWAEKHREYLETIPFVFFPCLNPHGLIENLRSDSEGRDLNRCFNDPQVPVIAAWQKCVGRTRFSRCLNLHEDFDAQGIYLYEISDDVAGLKVGETILSVCESIIPRDPREYIEGQPFDQGLTAHRRSGLTELVERELSGGYPEAIELFLGNATSSAITFETPSEWHISQRIDTHIRAIETWMLLDQ